MQFACPVAPMWRPNAMVLGLTVLVVASPAVANDMTNCQRLAAIGASVEGVRQLAYDPEKSCLWTFWRKFQWRPLTEVLTAEDERVLAAEIDLGHCSAAESTVRDRFMSAHPLAPPLNAEPHYGAWRRRLATWYPALATCLDVEKILELQAEIERSGEKVPPYSGPGSKSLMTGEYQSRVYDRDRLVNGLALRFLAISDRSAALALLRWSVEGRIAKSQADRELYIAYWLSDHRVIDPLVGEIIGRQFDPIVRADIQRRVSIHPQQMPAYAVAP
jgi:hypothetical protein